MTGPATSSDDRPRPRRRRPYRTGDAALDAAAEELVGAAGIVDDADLVLEMVVSALRLGREPHDRHELKLLNSALKELRHAIAVFAPYEGVPKVSIFGSARVHPHEPAFEAARAVGARMAERGWMVITGAGPGIMTAGIEGAGASRSFGVSIVLPFEEAPTPLLVGDPKLVNFRYFFSRKVTFMKESKGFVLLPGGFGTLDEAFELLTLLQTGRTNLAPVVLLDEPGGGYWEGWRAFIAEHLHGRGFVGAADLALVRVCPTVDEAVDELVGFYDTYHSMRYVGRRLVLRLERAVDDDELAELNTAFADIVVTGRIERCGPTDAEVADDDVVHLHRLRLVFDRTRVARLRQLVDALNANGRDRPTGTTPGRTPFVDTVDEVESLAR